MTRIRVVTQDLTNTADLDFCHQPWNLITIAAALNTSIGQLDTAIWAEAGCGGEEITSKLDQVGPGGMALAAGISELYRMLKIVAETFEETDYALGDNELDITWAEWDSPSDANPSFCGTAAEKDQTAQGKNLVYGFLEGGDVRLFVDDGDGTPIHPGDITQGYLGDCYFMSSLAALAGTAKGRELLRNNITVNEDGTYTVTLYERDLVGEYQPVQIHVTPEFPLYEGNGPVFAQPSVYDGGTPGDPSDDLVEIWPLIYEKAYAQHFGEYADIEAGWGAAAMEALTGQPSQGYVTTVDIPSMPPIEVGDILGRLGPNKWLPESIETRPSFDQLEGYAEAGYAITAGTIPIKEKEYPVTISLPLDVEVTVPVNPLAMLVSDVYWDERVMGSHEYYVVDVGIYNGVETVVLRNPHGHDQGKIFVEWEEFRKAFPVVSVNPITE